MISAGRWQQLRVETPHIHVPLGVSTRHRCGRQARQRLRLGRGEDRERSHDSTSRDRRDGGQNRPTAPHGLRGSL